MAEVEYLIGTCGPYFIDDTDPEFSDDKQVIRRVDMSTEYYNKTESDARFAPIAKGVTNGDSHDHSGGDGAQIAHSNLSGLSAGDDHTQYALRSANVKFTAEGGLAIKLVNKTGSNSVKGTVIRAGTVVDNSFSLETEEFEAIGVVYDNGIADGNDCFVVVSGIAEVLLKDGTAATRGYWVKCADIDGRAEVTTPPTGIGALSTAEHFKEIGHCIESKSSGTNVLAKIVLHFN